jgi:hypothetical protein
LIGGRLLMEMGAPFTLVAGRQAGELESLMPHQLLHARLGLFGQGCCVLVGGEGFGNEQGQRRPGGGQDCHQSRHTGLRRNKGSDHHTGQE